MKQKLHCSKILITNDGEPVYNGSFLVENSKITKVGRKEDFGHLHNSEIEIIDHGNTLICPGFINLHTHLSYSRATRRDDLKGLFPWLENLVVQTKTWTKKDYIESINYGIKQALSTGTTYIVENTPNILSAKVLAESSLKVLVGLEIFGSDEGEAEEIFQKKLLVLSNQLSIKNIDFTFSPHAPYDVSKPLWKNLAEWSNQNKKILLTHLEESPEEKNWWQNKSGNAINFWKKINKLESKLKYWEKYTSGIDFLNKNNLLANNLLAAHLVQTTEEELKILKDKNVKAVHCPRSNYFLNNGTANIKLWEDKGILWGIGTDSLASNDSLDMLEEIRFTINQQKVIYNYNLTSKKAFKALTLNAGKILSKKTGALKEGFEADFLVYSLDRKVSLISQNPYDLLIFNLYNKTNLKEVWINGEIALLKEPALNRI